MALRIDVHCHVFSADSVEIASFLKAYDDRLASAGAWQPPVDLLLEIVEFFVRANTGLGGVIFRLFNRKLKAERLWELAESCGAAELAREHGWDPDGLRAHLEQFLAFARTLTLCPKQVVEALAETYASADVDLFVPLMTDYEEWLEGRPPMTVADRLAFKTGEFGLNGRDGGRFHLFAPFCPLRAVREGVDTSLTRVRDLIENQGFLGVKLYPRMGYYPTGNAAQPHPEGEPRGATWSAIDAALAGLYDLCVELDVPITAHCASGGARSPYHVQGQGHPRHWRAVLDQSRWSALRLNLAHMGGGLTKGYLDWARAVAHEVRPDNRVWTDLSCQVMPREDDGPAFTEIRDNLHGLLETHPVLRDRVMAGSDWHLVVLTPGYETLFERFDGMMHDPVFPAEWDLRDRFFGENAADFLGLRAGQANRARLAKFYQIDTGGRPPAWWEKTK